MPSSTQQPGPLPSNTKELCHQIPSLLQAQVILSCCSLALSERFSFFFNLLKPLATVHMWSSKDSLECWASPSSLFETGSLVFPLCMLCQLHGILGVSCLHLPPSTGAKASQVCSCAWSSHLHSHCFTCLRRCPGCRAFVLT